MKIYTQRGFTIIELMVSIALLAAMVVIGVPSFNSIISTNETAAKSNAFLSALKVARSEATKRRQNIIVCASNNQADCSATDWSSGWIVFEDSLPVATSGNGAFDAGETIIDTYNLPTGFTITRASGGVDQIIFASTGLSDSSVAQTFTVCKANTATGRRLIVDRSGLVTGADVTCP